MRYAFDDGWVDGKEGRFFNPRRLDLEEQRTLFATFGILAGLSDGPRKGRRAPEVLLHNEEELGYVTRELEEDVDYTKRHVIPKNQRCDCSVTEVVIRNPALQTLFKDPVLHQDQKRPIDPDHCRSFASGLIGNSIVRSAHDDGDSHSLVMWKSRNPKLAAATYLMLDVMGQAPFITNTTVTPMNTRQSIHYVAELNGDMEEDAYVWPPPGNTNAALFLKPADLRRYIDEEHVPSNSLERLDYLVDRAQGEGGAADTLLRMIEFRKFGNLMTAQRLGIISTTENVIKREHGRLKEELRHLGYWLADLTAEQRKLDEFDHPDPHGKRIEARRKVEEEMEELHKKQTEFMEFLHKPANDGRQIPKVPRRPSGWSYGKQQARWQQRAGIL